MNLLAITSPKADAIKAVTPNSYFEPFPALPYLAAIFFIISAGMIWLMLRSGKDADYGD
jgi:hypothetical protein